MSTETPPNTPAIVRLVEHNEGSTALAAKINARAETPDQTVHRQQIDAWVKRRWASPTRFLQLQPFMPKGMRIADLYEDKKRAIQAEPTSTPQPAQGPSAGTPGRRAYDHLPAEPMHKVLIDPDAALFDRRHAPDRRAKVITERRRR